MTLTPFVCLERKERKCSMAGEITRKASLIFDADTSRA